MVIRVHDDKVEEYKKLHRAVWPGVLKTLTENGVRDFTIFLKEPENILFGVFDYVGGDDYSEAAKRIAADPVTQEWWAVCMPMQDPLETRAEDEWWASMEEVFHTD